MLRTDVVPGDAIPMSTRLIKPAGTQDQDPFNTDHYVRFFRMAVPIKDVHGEVVDFKEQEYVEFEIPGDPDHKPIKKVNKQLIAKYPRQYKAWKDEEEQKPDGLSIELLPGLTSSQVALLKYRGVHVIEQLANLDDIAKQNLGIGADDMVRKAKGFIATRANVAEERAKSEKLAAEIEELRKTVAALSRGDAPRRGRPPKVAA